MRVPTGFLLPNRTFDIVNAAISENNRDDTMHNDKFDIVFKARGWYSPGLSSRAYHPPPLGGP